MKKWEIALLILIFVGAFVVRLYRFTNPIADWHSWRQADTSAVARNFTKFGFDLLHPRIDNVSNVQTNGAFENPKGYFFAEFPIYNGLQAGLFTLFHNFTIEEWGRIVTIFSSLGIMVFIYLLSKKYANSIVGMFSIFFYAFLPFVIYYSRTVLPQSSMLLSLLASIYFFDKAVFSSKKQYFWYVLSAILCAVAILISPYAAFYFLPYLYVLYKKWGKKLFAHWQPYVFTLIAVLPFILWRIWMLQYPEGIPANSWLFNGGDIRFTGAYFYWIFADRLARLILGYYGVVLLVLGFLIKRKNWGFFFSFFLSSLLFLAVIARGNVQHDYYQLIIMPSIVLMLALGAEFFVAARTELFSVWTGRILLAICVIFSLAFSWYFVRDYFDIDNPLIVTVGKVVDQVTPKNAKILTFYNGDSTFLYQMNRQGWASLEKPIGDMVSLGADYLVILNPTQNDLQGFGKEYKAIASTPTYLILDLHHSP